MNIVETDAAKSIMASSGIDLMDQFAGTSQKDLIIPKLLLMQPMHPLVTKEMKRQMGEIATSEGGAIADESQPKGPIRLVPFYLQKFWKITKPEGNREVFVRKEAVTPENSHQEWGAFFEGDEDHVRRQTWYLYGFLSNEFAAYGNAFPVVVEFQKTSFQIGKQIYSKGIKLRELGLPLFSQRCVLGSKQQTNDMGTFFVWTLDWEKAVAEEIQCAVKWFKTLKSAEFKVKEEAEPVEATNDEGVPF